MNVKGKRGRERERERVEDKVKKRKRMYRKSTNNEKHLVDCGIELHEL